jgi:hypothetical protein
VYQLSRQSQPSRKSGAESGRSLTHKNKTKMADLPQDKDPYGVLGLLLFQQPVGQSMNWLHIVSTWNTGGDL